MLSKEPSEEEMTKFLDDIENFLHSPDVEFIAVMMTPHSLQMLYMMCAMTQHVLVENGLGVELFDEMIEWLEKFEHLDCFRSVSAQLMVTIEETLDALYEGEDGNG